MAKKYIKHNSNYIKTKRHQFLKDGSTIFERDWVTVGSQLNFGPGKVPYYNNGNFIFTTSLMPYYQKKHKNGVTVATWTYEDVQETKSDINQIKFDEHTEDLRTYAYYGSCVELVRSTVEDIINTFPGNITVAPEKLSVLKAVETFTCKVEDIESDFVVLDNYYPLNNPFEIDITQKDPVITQYDNDLRYLTYSYPRYKISTNNGQTWSVIETYDVINRQMYEKDAPECEETVKTKSASISFTKSQIDDLQPKEEEIEEGETQERFIFKTVSLTSGNYYLYIKDNGVIKHLSNWSNLCYKTTDQPGLVLSQRARKVKCDKNFVVSLILNDGTEQVIYNGSGNTGISIIFYKEVRKKVIYKYYQMFDDNQYQETFKDLGWVKSKCLMDYWLPDTMFLDRCDDVQDNIIYSEDSQLGYNQPVYTITINGTTKIEGYIYNKQVIPLVTSKNIIIQPIDDVIEEYFKNLEGFKKLLLTRKTTPQYTNRFITPIEYDLGFVYYKRTYTWPSNGYCIDISSTKYIDYITNLKNTAELLDELWTDNLWKRMTHEAIRNYDWTYTREFVKGEEEDNVDGGERMHKVLNIIARVFDDIKREIDTIKKNNKASYDADRNMANALLSDKLELYGWDVYSTIPTYEEINEQTQSVKVLPASQQKLDKTFLTNTRNRRYTQSWYPTLNPYQMTFSDVDIEFMRKLLLSSKRIFMTKGTRQSIDMIMGMFGYGNMDEEHPDYTITEEYTTVEPIDYDKIDENDDETIGDKIVRLNMAKENELLYDDDASGIPVGSFSIFENSEPKTYLIPFYNQNKIYDGNFYFQGKGGWFYNKKDENDEEKDLFKWTETLSYLHVVSQVKDLMSVNPNSVSNGDIFYVVNINDYADFSESLDKSLYSRFFVLEDDYNTDLFSSWTNLDLSGETYVPNGEFNEEGYDLNGNTQEQIDKYKGYVEKAKYLNNIISYNLGNNPHVGYGKYDKGDEYFEYMEKPFKYALDSQNFSNTEDEEEAEKIVFKFADEKTVCQNANDKIQIFADVVNEEIINSSTSSIKPLRYAEYDMQSIKEMEKTKYYINSKVIHIINHIENDEYRKYFKTVIINYLMQVIPSTSIIILENFEEKGLFNDDVPEVHEIGL